MQPVLILQQTWHDTPDHFLDFLQRAQLSYELRRMDHAEPVPERAIDYSGICLLGGPMSANDGPRLPWVDQQIALTRTAIAERIPVIGHCLGGQLMTKALGGTVQASPQPEIGWSRIHVHASTESQRWFGDATELPFFQWHGESFSLPAGAHWLAHTAACPHQAYAYDGIHFAMQFHCEVKAEKLRIWVEQHHDEIDVCAGVASVQQGREILQDLPAKLQASQQLADRIYEHWVRGLQR